MTHYFFHVRLGNGAMIADEEGISLRDADQAWQTARTAIRDLLADPQTAPQLMTAVMEVVDPQGEIVLEFPFSEALSNH